MNPSDSMLHLLKDKEVRERDRRMAHTQSLRERLAQLQAQTTQLNSYRQHYQDHWQLQFRQGATPQVMQCYRQFVQRLDDALAQQAHTVGHVGALLQQAEAELMHQEIRVASIDKLMERQAQRIQLGEQRAQQRQDDEFAQRSTRNRSTPFVAELSSL